MIVEEEEEDNVNEKLIIQQSIPKSLRDAMSIIIEHSVKEALKEQDLADICILESDESFMRLFSVSVRINNNMIRKRVSRMKI
jgi:hypothetical protein